MAAIGYNSNSDNFMNNLNMDEGITIGEYWKKLGDNPPKKKKEIKIISVPRQPVKIDKSLGCKLCEHCSNYVDNIRQNYLECKAKKLI